VQLAIVMLGPDLRIRRFTPQAERLLNLVPADIGRPLRDVKLTVDLPELEQLVLEVIETVAPQQREARDRDGRWHSIRIRPYRTADNRIDGAVLVSVDVDSLKRTEESLRSSEERLRITWEQAPIGIFETDLEGRFLRVNDPFCAIVGRPREQLLRVHSTDITHQDDVPADLEGFQRLSRGEVDALHLEKRYVHGAGHPVWVEIHRFNVKDDAGRARFTVGFVQDIGERKAAEAAVRQREARFRGVMDGAPVLIWMNGVEGTEYVNRAFLEFLGVGLADVLGTSWQRFVHDDDREAYAAAYRAALARLQPFEHQFRFRRADGEYRWMMAVALPQFGAASQFVGYTGSTFDITDFKRAEGALRDDDQRKNEFIATLAHELRNPLAPIANVAHLLRTPGIAERTIAWAHDVLQRQLGSLTRMVDDLLDVSRITQDKIRLHREPVDLADVITRSVDAAREGFARRALRIMVEVPTKPLILFADPVRLEQVLGNLLNNATKFTPQGGHIWLTATETSPGKDVTIRLRDDGDGIDGEVLPHVFEMFRQGDMSIARAHGGLGIGLTLVRRLIELHGGTVEAKSDGPGKGSELIVRLPLAETGTGAAARPAVPPSTDGGTRRILIIDDNADAATSLAFLLRHDGHVVEVAHSGPTGLDTTRAFKPQVVLLDLGMPGMNGFEVARRLRQDAHGDDLIIVATSGYSGEDMRRRAQEAGFDEYIVKPIDRAILHTLLGRGRASPV
jgi:PAS domain S-box-containing protein